MKKVKVIAIWHRDKQMPTSQEVKAIYGDKGKYVGLSPAVFGGWYVWILRDPTRL